MNRLPQSLHDGEAFFASAMVMHDEIIASSIAKVTDRVNAPYRGQDLWDSYFIDAALGCLARPRTKALLFTRPNAVLGGVLSRRGVAATDCTTSESRSLLGALAGRLFKANRRPGGGIKTERVLNSGADLVIIDTLINETPDPIDELREMVDRLGPDGVLIAIMRISTEGPQNYFDELGFVLPSREQVVALQSESLTVDVALKASHVSDSWPFHDYAGVFLRVSA